MLDKQFLDYDPDPACGSPTRSLRCRHVHQVLLGLGDGRQCLPDREDVVDFADVVPRLPINSASAK